MVSGSPSGLRIDDVLLERFGFAGFRPGQRELIEAVLAGRDALGVLPTGGGKSICYQLPSILLEGLTVVVSPLIALMKDQVDAFNRRKGAALAVALNSSQSWSEAQATLGQVHRGEAALLYVAPERMEFPEFRARLKALGPRLLVIDEAHCVSLWGHDFRPSYLCLGAVARALRPCPILALTATATPATREDIARRLGLAEPVVHVAPFDRPNLRFEVHPCGPGEKPRRLRRILRNLEGGGSQIIYVGRRRDADSIAAELSADGLGAVAYHAGMDARRRKEAQEAWLAGKKPIAVATIAFGMGIDKPDVRAVIHHQHPPSLESYYQEAGRAGRDGAPARCILLFSAQDSSLARFFIRNRYPTREQVLAVARELAAGAATLEEIKDAAPGLNDEKVNVSLLALLEEGWLRKEDGGPYTLIQRSPDTAHLSLDAMFRRKDGDYRRLDAVVRWAGAASCLRAPLLDYFGEEHPANHRCGNCSACDGGTGDLRRAADLDEVERILEVLGRSPSGLADLSPTLVARFLSGSRSKRIPPAWKELPQFGVFSSVPVGELRELSRLALSRRVTAPAAIRDGRPAGGEVFWSSPHRSFDRAELAARQVERQRGLLILELAAAAPGGLAPSRIAGVLRGAGRGDWKPGPALPHRGALDVPYDELLPDVLAMWAKGYLEPIDEDSKKLVITEKGRTVLERKKGGNSEGGGAK
jgi:ATP-dependent DNA helicase RecQ